MATIYIDGKSYEVDSQDNLLHVCLSLELDLPYFCWHPALGSVGACRQCAVKQFKDEDDDKGQIVMACMTPAADGTFISIEDQEAKDFRASVIEWLMVNHPHDCPICDEGGECHLQDMTVMTGHTYRRYRFKKRTYHNQYLGPFINHEMNRCIQCYRCVRFYREYAGGRDLDVFGAHDHVYFGRQDDGVLESEFSGNLVEICPTGVFTDKSLKRHYTRKWDLQTAPSVCTQCSLGCNTIPGERYGQLRRIRDRFNYEVNGYFLCDRGRYGYEFVNSDRRLYTTQLRHQSDEDPMPASTDDTLKGLKEMLDNPDRVIGIGSPQASLEANYALCRLVGPDRFYTGFSAQEQNLVELAQTILRQGPAHVASLRDVEESDAVLILGEDVTNTAPRLALALRQAIRVRPMASLEGLGIPIWNDAAVREVVQDAKGPLFLATTKGTKLDDVATETYRATPADLARLGLAIAHTLDEKAPPVTDLPESPGKLVEKIAGALKGARKPLVVCGTSAGSQELLQAAANVVWALGGDERQAGLFIVMPEANSFGLGLMEAKPLQAALEAVQKNEANTVIVLENDLSRRVNPSFLTSLREAARNIVVLDALENDMTKMADVILPAATFAEGDGTLVNNEGRAQRFYQVFVPQGQVQESWRWLQAIGQTAGWESAPEWLDLDDVVADLAEELPVFEPVTAVVPPADYRAVDQRIPRQPHRYSGRTAMQANLTVHEPKPPEDPDTPLSFSMEGYKGRPPAELIPRYWTPGWNSVQALNKFQQEVGEHLQGDGSGQRLIEAASEPTYNYFDQIPQPFEPQTEAGEWLALPQYHIFGSEPSSMMAPGVAELAPPPYLALHPNDAKQLGIGEGESVRLQIDEISQSFPVRFDASLPSGATGFPVGLPGMPALSLPAWVQLGKEG